jgi:hypothetical protein
MKMIENLPYEVLVCGMRVHGYKDHRDPREPYIPKMDLCLKGTGLISKVEIAAFMAKLHDAKIYYHVFDYHRCSEEMKAKIDLYAVQFSKTYPDNRESPPKQWQSE